jgi:hypothetical protein
MSGASHDHTPKKTAGTGPASIPTFPIDDSNADIDAVLSALERAQKVVEDHKEKLSPEATQAREREIRGIEQAIGEVLGGEISLSSIQWIRSSLAYKLSEVEAHSWFPHAGSYISPNGLFDVLHAEEQAAEAKSARVTALPVSKELLRIQGAFADKISGVEIRAFDPSQDELSGKDRAAVHSFFQRKGMSLIPISPDMDLGALVTANNRHFAASEESSPRSMADSVQKLIDAGIEKMYHATGLFTYQALKGHWLLNTDHISQRNGDYKLFFMAGALDWNDGQGLERYIQSDRFYKNCEAARVPLTKHGHSLGEKGVLLEVNLHGYLKFLQSPSVHGFEATSSYSSIVACTVVPPPPEFIRPVAVFEYPVTGRIAR